ncbi:glutathione S-transferase [Acrasis kona]|uniref:Glutathione S-transferase n=1 Tax=Acrasis kona TaxID=1008807 RepID=A0AAW2YZ35_9EUKA
MTDPSAPTLHHLTSSQSLKVLWALEETGKKFNLNLIQRNSQRDYPHLMDLHPRGKSPILVDNGCVIAESRLVLEHIKEHYSDGRWNKSGEEKIRDDYFAEFSTATIANPLYALMMAEFFNIKSEALTTFAENELHLQYKLLDEALCQQPFFGGREIGISDFMMSWRFDFATQRGYIDVEKYPSIKTWYQTIQSRDAYKEALRKTGTYDLKGFT